MILAILRGILFGRSTEFKYELYAQNINENKLGYSLQKLGI